MSETYDVAGRKLLEAKPRQEKEERGGATIWGRPGLSLFQSNEALMRSAIRDRHAPPSGPFPMQSSHRDGQIARVDDW